MWSPSPPAGMDSMVLRADGTVVSWGNYNTPAPYTLTNVIAIACGGSHYLALKANGTVVGWGNNPYGQATIPAGVSNIVAISAGANHSVLLRNDGTVLTLGSYAGYPLITAPPDLANVVAIASGGEHDVALFGTRAPAFTVQPWDRSIPFAATTNITLAAKCAGVQPVYYQWQLNGTNVPAATNDTLTLGESESSPVAPIPVASGVYQLIASNAYGVAASKYAKITTFIPLGDALNTPTDGKGNYLYNWTTSGNAQWFGETNITHDGVSAAQSGGIGPLQETILQTTVGTNWSGRYTFWWKVSSEQDFDILEFRINGIVQTNISGESGLAAGQHSCRRRHQCFDVALFQGRHLRQRPGCRLGGSICLRAGWAHDHVAARQPDGQHGSQRHSSGSRPTARGRVCVLATNGGKTEI